MTGDPGARRTLLLSSSIGSIVEWYDFFVFASAAALVFDKVFFPDADPRIGVLYALMTYAVGFATRPVGGLLFGILGDRYGRKQALIWSLLLMGFATMGIGLIPGYATIGVAAPALLVLLRLIQGIAVGGEVGGALILVAESLPAERRGFWAAWPMIGGPAGNLLSAGVLALLGITLGEAAFAGWGWRVAFLASGGLIGIGAWMRRRVAESPLYQAHAARRAGAPPQPLWPTLLAEWRAVLAVFVVKVGENALFYVFTTFFVVYLTRVLELPRTLALEATALGAAVEVAVIIAAGAWSDRIGRRAVTGLGLLLAAGWSFLLFPVTAGGDAALVFLAAAIGGCSHGLIVGGMSPMFVELFPTSARYTGFSLGYQVASVAGGAVAPIIGVALLNRYDATLPVSLYALAMALPALVGTLLVPETKGRDLAL
jgi:MFS family permease